MKPGAERFFEIERRLDELRDPREEIARLWEERKDLLTILGRKWDGNGNMMKLGEWIDCVHTGGFIDYDGFGHYSDGKKIYDIPISPSNVARNTVLTSFTHVIWYNR
jgi:hypothetical protein